LTAFLFGLVVLAPAMGQTPAPGASSNDTAGSTPTMDATAAKQAAVHPPGADKESNWLPAPEGGFNVTMRMYWPRKESPSIIDGSWKPPAVNEV
jgi:hypothetical protein